MKEVKKFYIFLKRWFLLNYLFWKLQQEFVLGIRINYSSSLPSKTVFLSTVLSGGELGTACQITQHYWMHTALIWLLFDQNHASFARYKSSYIKELLNIKSEKYFLEILMQSLFDYKLQTCSLYDMKKICCVSVIQMMQIQNLWPFFWTAKYSNMVPP